MKAMMKKVIVLVAAACGIACAPQASSRPAANQSEQTIRSEFGQGAPGTALSVREKADNVRVEVCFDRCDYFEWGTKSTGPAWDFVLLYELREGFGSSAGALKTKAASSLQDLVAAHSAFCQVEKGSPSGFSCSWGKFAAAKGIRVGIAAYDEGQRCFAWRDLASMSWPTKSDCAPITESPWPE